MSPALLRAAEETTRQPIEWWVVVPSVVMLAFVVIVAPIWPYSRGWGWAPAGMSGIGLFVALLFTLAWISS